MVTIMFERWRMWNRTCGNQKDQFTGPVTDPAGHNVTKAGWHGKGTAVPGGQKKPQGQVMGTLLAAPEQYVPPGHVAHVLPTAVSNAPAGLGWGQLPGEPALKHKHSRTA
jgi:hypothetical protein